MSDLPPEKPRRRPRYKGPNPRAFHEKYKEHRPDQYAEDVAKVIARGATPAGMHRPIMVSEILERLSPRPGEIAVDCTLGHGGHARELLAAIQPGGKLIGLDADPIELPKTEARLRALGYPDASLAVHRVNHAGLLQVLAVEALEGVDVLLADLGLSSMQIDDPARGFTFKVDAPLDMRMNPNKGESAADWIARASEQTLSETLRDNADEPLHAPLAASIVRASARKPIVTTQGLAEVARAVAAKYRIAPDDTIKRVFQAVRIAVNDEFKSLETLLRHLPRALKPGGRAAILTFHSGEDRRVKGAFKEGFEVGTYARISEEPIRASAEERRDNPRSTSAKLRWAVRSG